MTIQQLQDYINSKPDTRQLINVIADYMQANPGGGGSQTLDEVLAEGAILTEHRTVDLNGKSFKFQQGATDLLSIDQTLGGEISILQAYNATAGGNAGVLNLSLSNTYAYVSLGAGFNAFAKFGIIAISADATTSTITHTADTHTFNGKIINPDLVAKDFADDAAAAVGLVGVGEFYHTAGVVKVRLT